MGRNIREQFGIDYLIPNDKDQRATVIREAAQRLIDNNAGPTSTDEGTNTHVLVRRADFKALEKVLKGNQ